jgi:hypothetical protein
MMDELPDGLLIIILGLRSYMGIGITFSPGRSKLWFKVYCGGLVVYFVMSSRSIVYCMLLMCSQTCGLVVV